MTTHTHAMYERQPALETKMLDYESTKVNSWWSFDQSPITVGQPKIPFVKHMRPIVDTVQFVGNMFENANPFSSFSKAQQAFLVIFWLAATVCWYLIVKDNVEHNPDEVALIITVFNFIFFPFFLGYMTTVFLNLCGKQSQQKDYNLSAAYLVLWLVVCLGVSFLILHVGEYKVDGKVVFR